MKKFGEFGFRHEVAKRWTLIDFYKANQVKKRIKPDIADMAISRIIELGEPALIGRLGGTEARFLGEFVKISKYKNLQKVLSKIKPNWNKRLKEINTNAGFYFENLEQVTDFFNLYDKALVDTDLLGAWGTAFAWIEFRYLNSITSFISVPETAPWVEPYSPSTSLIPWSNMLNGKKVLVVSPFTSSIIQQHKIIDYVFPKSNYPNYELTTIKAPQTIGYPSNSKPSWFENLNTIKNKMSDTDFDIAIIGAGAYSYPLAHHAKKLGKIGIHSGGGLQLFFGIMGKRWDDDHFYKKYWNKYWVRATLDETPTNFNDVEDGCYW